MSVPSYAELASPRCSVPRGRATLCRACEFDLAGQPILNVKGRHEPWPFVHCPRCEYDNAVWKLGLVVP